MKRLFIIIAALMLLFIPRSNPANAQTFPLWHDNSTAFHSWTHGDPNIGTPPKYYYYTKAKTGNAAPGQVIVGNCELYTPEYADIRLEDANKHILAETHTYNTGGRAWAVGLKPNAMYQCRIENDGATPFKDYFEENLFIAGDMTSGDCGGPGPVIDPNWNTRPMEPAHSGGLPANGCDGVPGADLYNASDFRASLPQQDTFDLGVNRGNATYTLVTTRYADLTAFVFFGSQGKWGTMTITDDNGNVVNGPKFGAAEANPRTMNQEYVGADAGQLPPGVYHIRFNGPSNSQHVWAISGNI